MSTTTKLKHREIAPAVRALVTEDVDGGPGQFRVVNAESPELEDWDTEYVCFSGYAGAYKPAVFAAAPELYAALHRLTPANVCTTNTNIGDDFLVPVDFTMGELRAAWAALAKARGEA